LAIGDQPRGTVTFLFTDIERSTELVRRLGDRYADMLGEHRQLLWAAFAEHGGWEIDTQGDAFFVAFDRVKDAVLAAVAMQRSLAAHAWSSEPAPRIRIGLHTTEPSPAVALNAEDAKTARNCGVQAKALRRSSPATGLVEAHSLDGRGRLPGERRAMHAAVTTTHGSNEDMAQLALMAGEAMVTWLRDIEGFHGLVMLTSQATGTTHVISFWESEQVAQRHRVARMKLRERITATLTIEVQDTESYDVSFADLPEVHTR
jgi:heme-degrading monooxygenase HmoA